MTRRSKPPADGSDIVLRVVSRLQPGRRPTVEHLEFLERSRAELEPFTIGDGFRERHLREFSDQLALVIADARQQLDSPVRPPW